MILGKKSASTVLEYSTTFERTRECLKEGRKYYIVLSAFLFHGHSVSISTEERFTPFSIAHAPDSEASNGPKPELTGPVVPAVVDYSEPLCASVLESKMNAEYRHP